MDKVDVEEKKKMFDLMKDRELGGNMDWMYRGDKPDTEEFLLGKSVDKLVTEATAGTTEDGGTSIISERIKANVALDMQAKMREDPLFAIRKKEEEAKKRLLENPMKMKQLERLVEQQRQQLKSKSSKKAKKEKKSKKKKKKKSQGSDSDSDSSQSEDDLVNQYLTILTQKKSGQSHSTRPEHKHERRIQDTKNNNHDRSSNRHEKRHHHHHHQTDSRPQRHSDVCDDDSRDRVSSGRGGRLHQRKKDRNSSSESEQDSQRPLHRQDSSDGEVSKRVYGLIKSVRHNTAVTEPPPVTKMKSESLKRSQSSSSSSRSHSISRSRSRSPKRSGDRRESGRSSSSFNHQKPDRKRQSHRSRSRSPVHKRGFTPPKGRRSKSKSPPRKRRSRTPPKTKLTAEERDKKLQEMMDNAKWRDEQRLKNVQRYREEDEKESSRLSKYQGKAGFLSSMMADHASNSSVEDRLKRNKYNIQRTRAALDKKFTQH